MAKDVTTNQISYFQHKLDKYAKSGETDKILYYIHKLKYLQVTVKHLEATGVGRTVNSLRHNGGLVGNKAKDLVNKWKKMVSAEDIEEEEEEEEECEGNDDGDFNRRADDDRVDVMRDQNGDDAEEDEEEEDDRLQIEEDNGSDKNISEYKPSGGHGYGYSYGNESPGGGDDSSGYNPLTSQMDYQLLNTATPSGDYYPSSIGGNNSHCSSPEGDLNSGWEDASPSMSSHRHSESGSKSSSKKSSREDKERHKKKDKDRDKDRPKDSFGSQEREKKKDHKHKAKHKDKDKDREDKKVKNKAHKQKDKERQEEKVKEKKVEEISEKPRSDREKDKKKYVVNGYGTPESDTKPYSIKPERENEKRESEEKHRDKSSGSNSHRKEERNRDKENWSKESNQERDSSDSETEMSSREFKVKDNSSSSSKDKDKNKHNDKHSTGSSKKDKSKHDVKNHESQREVDDKKKKSKRSKDEENDFGAMLMGFDSPSKKKKKKKKKDRKERDSSDEEQPTSSKSSHKRALTDDGDVPDAKKPKLLDASPQKLPKLPATLSGAALETPFLPEITPNYKPLPRVPLRDELPNQINNRMSDEETLNRMLQSKSGRRSKMYSGKSTGLQSVPTLFDSAIRVISENLDALDYTGNIPYDILRPVLERMNPQQLMNIEYYNPQYLEDTDILWENHCKKHFRNEKLGDMESWRDMFIRCFDEREKKYKSLTEKLQQKHISKAEPKRQIKLAFVNDACKVPKSVARAQAKYGTGVASGSAVKPGKANEIAARKTAMHNAQRAEKAAAAPRPTSAKNKKVAPLMAKTRQFYKKAFRR